MIIARVTAQDQTAAFSGKEMDGAKNTDAMEAALPIPTMKNVPKASPKSAVQVASVENVCNIDPVVSVHFGVSVHSGVSVHVIVVGNLVVSDRDIARCLGGDRSEWTVPPTSRRTANLMTGKRILGDMTVARERERLLMADDVIL
jgi:hypothetical protein